MEKMDKGLTVKFMFSKKAKKSDEIFTVKPTVKILSIFLAFLENMNFMHWIDCLSLASQKI